MQSGNLPNGPANAKHWPDFYSILESSPEIDNEGLRRLINALYIKANEQSDHRELNTRFYNQVLSQKVLPQCRRILLNEVSRTAYDLQWHLHRQGSPDALSYQDFIRQISSDPSSARALLLSDDEISILPAFGADPSAPPLSALKTPLESPKIEPSHLNATDAAPPFGGAESSGEAQEIIEGEEVFEGEEALEAAPMALATASASPVSNAFVVAQSAPMARKSGFPVLPVVAVALALGLGGAWKIWSSAKTASDAATATASKGVAMAPVAVSKAAAPAAALALIPPLMKLNSLAKNTDFEVGKTAWKFSAPSGFIGEAAQHDAKSGANFLTFWGQKKCESVGTQTIKGLKPGKYTLRAWARRGGGQPQADMFVEGYGGPKRSMVMPYGWSYVLNTISDIEVTNGQCTIGFAVKSEPNKTTNVDAVEFFKQ